VVSGEEGELEKSLGGYYATAQMKCGRLRWLKEPISPKIISFLGDIGLSRRSQVQLGDEGKRGF
jgi:hypothetical protein